MEPSSEESRCLQRLFPMFAEVARGLPAVPIFIIVGKRISIRVMEQPGDNHLLFTLQRLGNRVLLLKDCSEFVVEWKDPRFRVFCFIRFKNQDSFFPVSMA